MFLRVMVGVIWKKQIFHWPFPAYVLNISGRFCLQVNLLYDVLLPDDYDEIWSYRVKVWIPVLRNINIKKD